MERNNADISNLIACHKCDALSSKPELSLGQKAMCIRCGAQLFSNKKNSVDRTLAVSSAGLLFVAPAMTMPIIGIGLVGMFNEASLVDCIAELTKNKFYIIALCLFLFTIAIPIVRLITAFYISYSIKKDRITPKLMQFFSSYHTLDHWVMLNVFLLGTIVSMYKLISMAELVVGVGLIAFIMLLLCSTLVSVTLDQHSVWELMEQKLADKNR